MAGISHVLSIAKEALLTHQLSVQVAANNIANVDTPGYTRQSLALLPNQATPVAAGSLGGGVHGDRISRQYDQFMTQRIVSQKSTMGNLEAQQGALRIVEMVFNEAPGLAINDLMSQFWQSWQALSDNPEIMATRQSTMQAGQLLIDQLHNMNAEITQGKYDIGVSLDTAIADVNALTAQIAKLNVQISTEEGPKNEANDLRDQRDIVLKELGEMLDITYFENTNGNYTVLLADGHALVETNESWQVGWSDNQLNWVNTDIDGNQTSQGLGTGSALGGKIGGWLEIYGQLIEGQSDNYLGRIDAFANALIRELNQQHSQGVGLNKFTSAITGTSMATNTARLTSPVDATPAEAAKTIAAGTIVINDRSIGTINGATPKNGLAMGKAYNAVNAINDATAGVNARLTTLVAGSAITAFGAAESANFTINGVSVSYTSAGTGATDDATNIVQAINTAITNYNSPAAPTLAPQPQLSLEAVVGDGYNGGAVNSIVLRNTNAGDESRIIIGDVDPTDAAEVKLGLTNSTYNADLTHNTGEITLFSDEPFTIEAGTDDTILSQLGLGGGNQTTTSFAGSATSASTAVNSANFNLNNIPVTVNIAALDSAMVVAQKTRDAINIQEPLTGVTASINSKGGIVFTNSTTGDNSPIVVDSFTAAGVDGNIYGFTNFTAHSGGVAGDTTSDDGSFTYSYDDGGVTAGLQGFKYFNELETDGGSFDIWLYNSDGTLALPQAITVDLERAYDLYDVANAIENSIKNASSEASSWIKASVVDNRLQLNPDTSHHFAFANDTSNILQVAGLNTLFTGHSAGTIGINDAIANDLSMITAATVGANGQIFKGDNTNALKITNIQQQDDISFTGSTADSLEGFYNSLVGEIGNAGRSVNRDLEFNTLVENQMQEMRDSTSGVSLDEEMANLVKYQHAYSAAARLITMSDEMLKSLLDSIR